MDIPLGITQLNTGALPSRIKEIHREFSKSLCTCGAPAFPFEMFP
jgi:hypothetical protein